MTDTTPGDDGMDLINNRRLRLIEKIATRSVFEYDPRHPNDALIDFNLKEFTETAAGIELVSETVFLTRVNFADIAGECMATGTGTHGADLSNVSNADVMEIIRQVVDVCVNRYGWSAP